MKIETRSTLPLVTVTLATLLLIPVTCSADDRPAKPNIVLLLTDDLGWQDVKCYDIDEPSPMDCQNGVRNRLPVL